MNTEQDSRKGFRVFLKGEKKMFKLWMRSVYRFNHGYFFNGLEDLNNTNLAKDFLLAHTLRVLSYPVSNGCATYNDKNIIHDIFTKFESNLNSWAVDPKTIIGRSIYQHQTYKLQMRRLILRFVDFYKTVRIHKNPLRLFMTDSDDKLFEMFVNLLESIIEHPNSK